MIRHDGDSLFEGIPSTFEAIRYRSLLLRDIPDCLEVTAECDGQVMAIRHRARPMLGGSSFIQSLLGHDTGNAFSRDFLARVGCNDRRVENERSSATHHSQDVSVQTLRLLHEELPLECEADALFSHCFSSVEQSFWLDSLDQSMGMGRFSYMGGLDGPLSGHFLYRVSEGRWVEAHGAHSELGPAFSGLRRMMSRYRLTTHRT